jgi:paraquat-inducible protein B
LDFFPAAEKTSIATKTKGRAGAPASAVSAEGPLEIPTVDGSLNELETSLTSIARKLDKVQFEQIGKDLQTAIRSLDETVRNADVLMQKLNQDVAPELQRTIEDARRTVDRAERLLQQDSPLQTEIRDTLREVGRSAQSLRTLTDYLDRHPEAMIRGRTPEDKP